MNRRVTGTYKEEPFLLFLTASGVGGQPKELVKLLRTAMSLDTWITPNPQPQPPRPMDPENPDDLLEWLRGVPELEIDTIVPPVEEADEPLPEGAVY